MQDRYVQFNDKVFFRRINLGNHRFVGSASLQQFGNHKKLKVNPDAYEILELLDQSLTIGECTRVLAEKYGLDQNILSQSVQTIIDPFIKHDLAAFSRSAATGRAPVIPPRLDLEHDFNINAVSLELLSACNLRCRHCYGEFDSSRTEQLDKETVFSLLDQLKELQCYQVSFTGGEVLLYQDFLEVLAYAHRHNFKVSFLTNGTLVTPELVKKLKAIGFMEIQVSIDGCTAEIHDAFRGVKGAFEKSLRAVEMLTEAGFTMAVAHVVNRTNYQTLEAMAEIANKQGIFLKVGPLLRYGNGSRNIDQLYIEPSTYYNVYKTAKDNLPPRENKDKEPGNNGGASGFPRYVERCSAGRGKLAIKASGDVVPCEILPPFDVFLMGNIHQSTIKEIAYGYDREARLGDFNALNLERCGGCPLVEECKGGCFAVSYAEYGDINRLDPFSCARVKAVNNKAWC